MTTFGFIPNVGFSELLVVLVLALIIFGPGKLPEVGKALGKSIAEFKGAVKKAENEIKEEIKNMEEEK
ncbi:MAG: twin-arginine translocation protein TatA/E family subunit [Peptococcaceae bacterium]|jgi:sec-independent protein translocase protein TatA|nr:twin-arginine translocation protein TatA/E family subunit [Peptococcaceae bacterium]